jgi:hypothetical protein
MFLGKRSQTVAVEDQDDEDQSNGVGKGKLRVLGAFGHLSKSIGSCNGNSGSGSLIGIKFELDFHCCEQQDGPKRQQISLGMKKSSIGGKQCIDHL